jgi:hypothetical protein
MNKENVIMAFMRTGTLSYKYIHIALNIAFQNANIPIQPPVNQKGTVCYSLFSLLISVDGHKTHTIETDHAI